MQQTPKRQSRRDDFKPPEEDRLCIKESSSNKIAFLSASFNGNFDKVKQLLKEGISTEVTGHIPGHGDLKALHFAALTGHDKVVNLLLKFHAKKNAVGNGLKAVHYAAKGGHVGVLRVLWDAGCNIKSKSEDGSSPLHLAAKEGKLEAVRWLVEKGAYLQTKNRDSQTPEDLARKNGFDNVSSYLNEKLNELKMNDLKEEKILGRGTFGEVFLVKRDGKYLVLKSINLSTLPRSVQEYAHREIKLLKSLKHPYIVSYVGGGFKGRFLYIQMEYCSGGTLNNLIVKQKGKNSPFEEQQIVNWSLRLCLALKYLHGRDILHRDLKPENIFMTGNGVIKLGDLGLAKDMDGCSKALSFVGSPAYMSPEVIQGTPYDAAADMWSLGCVMYELATLKRAFPYNNIKLPDFTGAYREAVLSLLQHDTGKRLTSAELLKLQIFHDALEEQLPEKEHRIAELNQEVEDYGHDIDKFMSEIETLTAQITRLKGEQE